jgi:hypothetical protein
VARIGFWVSGSQQKPKFLDGFPYGYEGQLISAQSPRSLSGKLISMKVANAIIHQTQQETQEPNPEK